ncbi:MAG: hypothetical protein AAGF95_03540 [Chloroflexota bacterium]
MPNRLFRLSPEQLQRCEPARARGKRYFIFWHGIVHFASIFFLVQLCILMILGYSLFSWFIPLLLFISLVTGVCWGWWMWHLTRPRYSDYEPPDKS